MGVYSFLKGGGRGIIDICPYLVFVFF
jgi:hypothetical protein